MRSTTMSEKSASGADQLLARVVDLAGINRRPPATAVKPAAALNDDTNDDPSASLRRVLQVAGRPRTVPRRTGEQSAICVMCVSPDPTVVRRTVGRRQCVQARHERGSGDGRTRRAASIPFGGDLSCSRVTPPH